MAGNVAPRTAELSALDHCVALAHRHSGLPVAFGGLVRPDQSGLSISSLRGTVTNSLSHLLVRQGEGLGGKALRLGRPASVRSYATARGITRAYDHAVRPEGLQAIVCLPVAMPGGPPLAVVYLADRHERALDAVASGPLGGALAALARDLHVERETARRVEAAREEMAAAVRAGLPDLCREMRALMEATADPATARGLGALLTRLSGSPVAAGTQEGSPLTRRETEVLLLAEQGAGNAEIGAELGLTATTVKSYMKAAMAKLDADNRVRACRTARDRGYLGPAVSPT